MNCKFNRTRWLRVTVLMGWAGLAAAQIAGPLTGHIYHSPTGSIRPILGVPGGAVLGGPVVSGARFGAVSHDGRWALIQREESAAMVGIGASEIRESPLDGLISGIDAAAWSDSGEAVVAWSSARKELQRVRFSGGEWVAEPPLDLAHLSGRLTSLGADFTGDRIAVGLTDPDHGGLYLVSGGDASLLMPAPLTVTAVFAPGGTLYAAGSVPGAVEIFEDGVRVGSLAGAVEAEVAGMRPAADGRRLLVAFKDPSGLVEFDLSTGQALSEHRLDAAPSALSPVAGGLWLVVRSPRAPQEPVVLVRETEPSAAFFVPVGEE